MLSPSSRNRIKEILSRVAQGHLVSFDERLYNHNVAEKDEAVNSWLKRARRIQQNQKPEDSIEELLTGLDLGPSEPSSFYNPERDDLGDWFTGATSWLERS
tara:strand:- start:183 stop:485 length:303 start_codon:yes stop_codon:yes gene_type:complete